MKVWELIAQLEPAKANAQVRVAASGFTKDQLENGLVATQADIDGDYVTIFTTSE